MSRTVKAQPSIRLKRAYEDASPDDGPRFLVERLWPRGVRKEHLRLDGWLKDAAPSPELRRWFGHDPDKWPEFRRRYFGELREHDGVLEPLRAASGRGPVTLVYGSRDTEHNAAVALREYIHLNSRRRG
ncbi:MAG TPA: DUF488 domain-containing protein [Gemmatimonadales bacterium]|nr:DUF488 domain-containing protein [Gemmatimonadales bacterium]